MATVRTGTGPGGAGAIVLAAMQLVIALRLLHTARLAARDAVPLSSATAIRTSRTTRSRAAWTAGHRAARPYLHVMSISGIAIGALTLVLGLAGGAIARVGWWIGIIDLTVIFVGIVLATRVANRAADGAP